MLYDIELGSVSRIETICRRQSAFRLRRRILGSPTGFPRLTWVCRQPLIQLRQLQSHGF